MFVILTNHGRNYDQPRDGASYVKSAGFTQMNCFFTDALLNDGLYRNLLPLIGSSK